MPSTPAALSLVEEAKDMLGAHLAVGAGRNGITLSDLDAMILADSLWELGYRKHEILVAGGSGENSPSRLDTLGAGSVVLAGGIAFTRGHRPAGLVWTAGAGGVFTPSQIFRLGAIHILHDSVWNTEAAHNRS